MPGLLHPNRGAPLPGRVLRQDHTEDVGRSEQRGPGGGYSEPAERREDGAGAGSGEGEAESRGLQCLSVHWPRLSCSCQYRRGRRGPCHSGVGEQPDSVVFPTDLWGRAPPTGQGREAERGEEEQAWPGAERGVSPRYWFPDPRVPQS